jgi:hypothetical protein
VKRWRWKSTLVVAAAFYDADQGARRVGGVNPKDVDRSAAQWIGVLFQDYANYELSVGTT